jgi:nucleoside-diphosphate-sugar epimerase
MKSMKKVLVTGGTGFIGSHLVDFLLSQKALELFVLIRDPNNLKWLKGSAIHVLKGDLFSLPALPSGLDTVFHLAGLTKAVRAVDYYTVNQNGTASLFAAMNAQKTYPRVVYLSSLAAVGPSLNDRPGKEDDVPHPVSPYGKSKRAGEEEALKFRDAFRLVVVRVGAVYGPRDEDFLQYFKSLRRGILPSLAGQKRLVSLCYVNDLVRALDICGRADLGSGEIFNIADPVPYCYEDLGRKAGKVMEKRLVSVRFPVRLASLAASCSGLVARIKKKPAQLNRSKVLDIMQDGWVADTSKARERLAFQVNYTLDQGIEETIAWYQENKWL